MAISLIFFILKKNKKLKLYIDYRKLSNITIKNQYLLLNANKFRNQLNKTKIFIKFNIKKVYNLIYIKKKEE